MATKIIVIGSINGKFEAIDKLAQLHAKNAFSLAIVLGDVFPDPAVATAEDDESLSLLLSGKISVPLPTYYTLGQHPLPPRILERLENGENVCENLYYLGKRSTMKTSEAVRIVALGGSLDPNLTAVSKDKLLPFHTEGDARALQGTRNVHILLTSNWPSSITSNSTIERPAGAREQIYEQCVADLCSEVKPRYHFTSSNDFFYEREPFFHLTPDGKPDTESITRFISLAAFGSPTKQKWMYAFTIDPKAAPPTALPAGTTASPLSASKKRKPLPEQQQSFSRFGGSTQGQHDHDRGPKRRKAPPPGPGECFFCLSNPNLATHLITSIGNDAYLTTAKGPLSTATTFPNVPHPAHILIIPLSHSPTVASITPPETRHSTFQEMERYRKALQSMLKAQSNGDLGAVTWEVSRSGGIHIHWQFLPVGADLVKKGLVEAAFRVEAENDKYPSFETKNRTDGADQNGDFFRVWAWSPAEPRAEGDHAVEKQLVLPLSDDFRFDVQFGRRVMAKLLGLESRLQWRDCSQSGEEEAKDAESFKQAFKGFDFSVEDA